MSSGKSPMRPRQAVVTPGDVNGFLYIERGVLNRWDLHAQQCRSVHSIKLPFSYDWKFYLRVQRKVKALRKLQADTFPVKTTQLKHLKKIVLARGAPQAIGSMTVCSSPLKK